MIQNGGLKNSGPARNGDDSSFASHLWPSLTVRSDVHEIILALSDGKRPLSSRSRSKCMIEAFKLEHRQATRLF